MNSLSLAYIPKECLLHLFKCLSHFREFCFAIWLNLLYILKECILHFNKCLFHFKEVYSVSYYLGESLHSYDYSHLAYKVCILPDLPYNLHLFHIWFSVFWKEIKDHIPRTLLLSF